MGTSRTSARVASVQEAPVIAELLDRFNREYDTPTPGAVVLAARLERLLCSDQVIGLLAGEPAVGVALLTMRQNVWYAGRVALLDELYVVPAQRHRGIGTALLKAAEEACAKRGCEVMEINVDGEDHEARRFYERHGYVNRAPNQPEPQLYYSRELVPGKQASCAAPGREE